LTALHFTISGQPSPFGKGDFMEDYSFKNLPCPLFAKEGEYCHASYFYLFFTYEGLLTLFPSDWNIYRFSSIILFYIVKTATTGGNSH
jgi:hypothetical protein